MSKKIDGIVENLHAWTSGKGYFFTCADKEYMAFGKPNFDEGDGISFDDVGENKKMPDKRNAKNVFFLAKGPGLTVKDKPGAPAKALPAKFRTPLELRRTATLSFAIQYAAISADDNAKNTSNIVAIAKKFEEYLAQADKKIDADYKEDEEDDEEEPYL